MPRKKKPKPGLTIIYDTRQPVYECVAIDVNTQRDFLAPEGVLPIKNREAVLERIKQLINWCKKHHIPIISPIDSHRAGGESLRSPLLHCIENTPGQKKVSFTLLPKRYVIEHDASPSLPDNLFEKYNQVIIHKRTNDVFTNPKADRFFSNIQSKRMLIFGVGAERAIKLLVLGLLSRCQHPIIVKDACGYWDKDAAQLSLRKVQAKGAVLIDTKRVIETTPENLPTPHIEIPTSV